MLLLWGIGGAGAMVLVVAAAAVILCVVADVVSFSLLFFVKPLVTQAGKLATVSAPQQVSGTNM